MREAFLSRWRIGATMGYNNGLPTGTTSVGDEDAVPQLGMALDIGAAAADPAYLFMGRQLGDNGGERRYGYCDRQEWQQQSALQTHWTSDSSGTALGVWATHAHTRKELRKHALAMPNWRLWIQQADRTPFRVLVSARELGAHLNYGRTVHNATMKKRIGIATNALSKLRFLPGSWAKRQMFARQGANCRAFWGAVATPLGKSQINAMRTAVVRAPRAKGDHRRKRRSVDIALNVKSDGNTHPQLYFIERRLLDFRRWVLRASEESLAKAARSLRPRTYRLNGGVTNLVRSSIAQVGWTLDDRMCIWRRGAQPQPAQHQYGHSAGAALPRLETSVMEAS